MLVAGVALGGVYTLAPKGIQDQATRAQLVSVALAAAALAPLLVELVAWMHSSSSKPLMVSTSAQVEEARQVLAELVLAQWREEIRVRLLDDPVPLMVRWRFTELNVTDHASHIVQSARSRGRLRFNGRSDRINMVAAGFRRLTRRRLIILGAPGMGKTTLAMLLLRELLEHPQADEPVPVLLTLSGWEPGKEAFHDWLTRRLREIYPALRATVFGPDSASALVAQGHILPVLDGLDELPESVRPRILTALNAGMTAADQLVLTCRTSEYQNAIADPGGDVITSAAVIEPEPVQAAEAAEYIGHCLQPRQAARWRHLLTTLKTESGAPISRTLATPLMVWLLRTAYIDTRTDPADLLSIARFPTDASIREHLLDHLVSALVAADISHSQASFVYSFRPHHAWRPEEAKAWLVFIAHHLNAIGTRDLAWWDLHQAVQVSRIRVVVGLVFGLGAGLIFWLAGGLLNALVFGLLFGTAVGLILRPSKIPGYVNLRLKGRYKHLAEKLAPKIGAGFAIGAGAGLMFGFGVGRPLGLVSGIIFIIGVGAGLIAGVVDWAVSPLTADRPQTPPGTLRRDVQLLLLLSLAAGSVATLIVALGIVLGGPPVAMIAATLGSGLVGVFVSGHESGFSNASTAYFASILLLYAKGRIPFRLMRFLDDAHRSGILRQAGPVYQFRHADFQDHLARHYQMPSHE